jgi:8-oxo-dGTP pyrophosphatase MutT (NUDIX family)
MQVNLFHAAGGVVVHGDRVLVLRSARYSDLRLPKGHVEEDELPHAAALREVAEESGYGDLEIVADLGEQVVEFDVGDTHTIRHERYFLMRLRSERQIARPGDDDDKFKPEWLRWDDAIAGLAFDEERRWLVVARESEGFP